MSADAVQRGRLYHDTPGWVPEGKHSISAFTEVILARPLLDSVRHYHNGQRWFCRLFLLMPDHLHALLAFPSGKAMSQVIKEWKSYHARQHQVIWQEGYFDHRIRNRAELEEKADYIRKNPVVKGLIARSADWRWIVDQDSLVDG